MDAVRPGRDGDRGTDSDDDEGGEGEPHDMQASGADRGKDACRLASCHVPPQVRLPEVYCAVSGE
ncbi:hypothetical protein GCM10009750_05050 [Agromyces salentinus]|uniref:Uncharacterized protein n=1 Tax=Agromyces salentinus TaxID=269421 RepID=A0ABP4YND6_9MICO